MTAQRAFEIAMMGHADFARLHESAKKANALAYENYASTSGTRNMEAGSVHAIGHGSWVSGFTGQAEWLRAAAALKQLENARGLRFDGPAVGWRLNRVYDDSAAEYLFCGDFLTPIATHNLVSREEIPQNPAELVAMVRMRAAA